MGHSSVVVEIGTDLIKIFQPLKGRGRHDLLKVVRIADLKLPLVEELPSLFQSLRIRTREVITYLPRKVVTMRFLELPSTDEEEVADMIRLQGIKQTPYSPEEVVLSHAIVGSRQEGTSSVVLAFCQRKFVDERIELLERCGFKVGRVGISTEGVVAWYLGDQADKRLAPPRELTALIDLDLNFSDLVFCLNGKFIYSKSILSGSGQAAEGFCDEVMRAIEFTMEETGLEVPKKAVLLAPLPEGNPLRRALESKLQFPVEFCNPTRDLKLPKDSPAVGKGSITPLLGFGGDKGDILFDMMPEDVKLGISLEKRGRQMVTTAILIIGLLGVIGFLVATHFYKQKQYLETLEGEIANTEEFAASIEQKSGRTRLLERIRNPESSFLHYLKKIAGVLAPQVYFNSIEFAADKQVVLKGYAGEMSEVFNFAKALEELKIFKGVTSERVSKKRAGEQVLAEFEINCLL